MIKTVSVLQNELQPRDLLSQAIFSQMEKQDTKNLSREDMTTTGRNCDYEALSQYFQQMSGGRL